MGRMKEFGMELAYLIYREKRDDDYIMQIYRSRNDIDPQWLYNQIQTVRENPELWDETHKKKRR